MRKNRATDLFAPSVVAKPCHTDEWMAFGRAAFEIRVTLIIHGVQQPHDYPKLDIFAAQFRKLFQQLATCRATSSHSFGLDPVVKNISRAVLLRYVDPGP